MTNTDILFYQKRWRVRLTETELDRNKLLLFCFGIIIPM